MRIRALTCSLLQQSRFWIQNPSEATPWGFDSPSRHQSITTLFPIAYDGNQPVLANAVDHFRANLGYKIGTVRIRPIFNNLLKSCLSSRLRITVHCALFYGRIRIARRLIGPPPIRATEARQTYWNHPNHQPPPGGEATHRSHQPA
jgi:hypothetical protein